MLDDYPGCRRVYETFVLAAAAHRHNEERKHSVVKSLRSSYTELCPQTVSGLALDPLNREP